MVFLKTISLLLLSFLFAMPLQGQELHSHNIESLKGEKWWGGNSYQGSEMPFKEGVKVVNYSKVGQNSSLLVSNKGRYIWIESLFSCQVDSNGDLVVSTDSAVEVKPIKAGRTLREAYLYSARKLFTPQSKMPDSLMFTTPSYNYRLSNFAGVNHTKNLMSILSRSQENRVTQGTIILNRGWEKYNGSFEFDKDRFPSPLPLIEKAHSQGFKILCAVSPFVTSDGAQFRELYKNGMILKKKGRNFPRFYRWKDGFSAIYNLSEPDILPYLDSKLENVVKKYGVDGFKFVGSDVFTALSEDGDEDDGLACAQLSKWNEVGRTMAFNQYTSAFNAQKYPLTHAAIRGELTFENLKNYIPNMLAAGLLGYPFCYGDLAVNLSDDNGKKVDVDSELIVRWTQIQALMPIMQLTLIPDGVLSPTHLDYCHKAVKLHASIAPYILSLAKESSVTGAPIVRSLEYQFPSKGFYDCNDQFMLGSKYLVAPFLTTERSRMVRLPNGHWKDDMGGLHSGPAVINISGALDRIPYFEYLTRSEYYSLKRKR